MAEKVGYKHGNLKISLDYDFTMQIINEIDSLIFNEEPDYDKIIQTNKKLNKIDEKINTG